MKKTNTWFSSKISVSCQWVPEGLSWPCMNPSQTLCLYKSIKNLEYTYAGIRTLIRINVAKLGETAQIDSGSLFASPCESPFIYHSFINHSRSVRLRHFVSDSGATWAQRSGMHGGRRHVTLTDDQVLTVGGGETPCLTVHLEND